MRVLICGMDGYLGWPLALKLTRAEGFDVVGLDNYSRREMVSEVGSDSAIPIAPMEERLIACQEVLGEAPSFHEGDLRDYAFVVSVLEEHRPDAVVHLGEMPSAPYSMADVKHAYFTQENNVLGTLNLLFAMRDITPDAHLVKLGTMGEYGTPDIDIPEGFFEVEYGGRKDRLPFPRQPGSFYHLSKVHDSFNIMFACKVWGLRSTDIMQGVVYGTDTDELGLDPRLRTRFDFDEFFGTAINRFCAQAIIGSPITPFGSGLQKRGFIALRDSIRCMTLALSNPAQTGEYRVFNQFDEVYDLRELAETVQDRAGKLGIDASISHVRNPRIESEEHYYNPDSSALRKLGFVPQSTLGEEIDSVLRDLLPHRDRVLAFQDSITPTIDWDPRGASEPSGKS